ncbi:MAG: hypothetical protein H7841_18645, partial [Magnetospirillum sp. WYHS-4]
MQERAPDLADTYLRRLLGHDLPDGARRALIGDAEPERIPVGVLKDEWEKRRSSDTMDCTPEKCGNDARPLGPARVDDPEDEDRQRRLAHIERRRAERGSVPALYADGDAGADTLAGGAGDDRPSENGAAPKREADKDTEDPVLVQARDLRDLLRKPDPFNPEYRKRL